MALSSGNLEGGIPCGFPDESAVAESSRGDCVNVTYNTYTHAYLLGYFNLAQYELDHSTTKYPNMNWSTRTKYWWYIMYHYWYTAKMYRNIKALLLCVLL